MTKVTETKQGSSGTITDVTTNHYDNFDRLDDTTQRGMTIDYEYDLNGNRTKVKTTNGETVYDYDERNRLKTADADGAVTVYAYYADGKKDTIAYPNNTGTKYTYYNNNRIQSIVHTSGSATLSSYEYAYDVNGNRMLQKELQNAVLETTTYQYDTADRMTRFAINGPNTVETSYTFEGYDRDLERVTENGELTKQRSYQYDELNRLTNILDSTSHVFPFTIHYEYDHNGNTLSKTTSNAPDAAESFTYDSRNQLIEVKRGPPGSEESLGKYDYNAEGLRIRHRNSERGDVDYYYDDNAVLEEHKASDNSLLAFYRYADRLISLETRDQQPQTRNQYYHHDALGSTIGLTDSLGSTQVSYRLDAWGHIRQQVGDSVNRQIFTGQEHDLKTGLIYFGARFYDPDTARFITQDSYLGEQGTPPSLDRYLYAYSNPTVYWDPTGYAQMLAGQEVDNIYKDPVAEIGPLFQSIGKYMDLPIAGYYTRYGIPHFDGTAIRKVLDEVLKQGGFNKYNRKDAMLFLVEDGPGEKDALRSMAFKYLGTGFVAEYNKNPVLRELFDKTFEDIQPGQLIVTHFKLFRDALTYDRTNASLREMDQQFNDLKEGKLRNSNSGGSLEELMAYYAYKIFVRPPVTSGVVLFDEQAGFNERWEAGGSLAFDVALTAGPAVVKIGKSGIQSLRVVRSGQKEALILKEGADNLVLDTFGRLSRRTDIPGQAHHLNQTAAYKDIIPRKQGVSVKLEGNVLTEGGSPHNRAHQVLENFWNEYRGTDIVPTNLEYTKALRDSLRAVGLNDSQIQQAIRAAIRERLQFGALGGMEVPRVPKPIRNLAQ